MTSKRPWYPWYPADYRNDTRHLTHVEDAVYRRLIDYVWEHECLPAADDQRMSLIVGLSVKRWRAIKATILAFFTEDFRHKRIDWELQKAKQISSKRSAIATANAIASAAKKTAIAGASVEQLPDFTRARDRATLHTSQRSKISALTSHTPPNLTSDPQTAPGQPTVSPLREESAQGGVCEESSQSPEPGKKQRGDHAAYPAYFEDTWEIYQQIASPNSVKAEAFRLWRKLDETEHTACYIGLMSYAADLQTTREKRPDAPAKYLETFIAKRAWEPHIDENMRDQIRQLIEARHAAK